MTEEATTTASGVPDAGAASTSGSTSDNTTGSADVGNGTTKEAAVSPKSTDNADVQKFFKTGKFKSVEDLAKSYSDLEKEMSGRIKLPAKGDTESETKFYEKYREMFVPADKSGYGIASTGKSDDIVLDALHKAGADRVVAAKLVAFVREANKNATAELDKKYSADFAEESERWGASKESNNILLNRGLEILGADTDKLKHMSRVIGVPAATSLFIALGKANTDGSTGIGNGKDSSQRKLTIKDMVDEKMKQNKT